MTTAVLVSLLGAYADFPPTPPAGFRLLRDGEERPVPTKAKEAPQWMVTLDDGRLRVETRVRWARRWSEADRIKWQQRAGMVQVQQTGVTILWKPGDGISVEGGWLCGYDFGEFGGGLYRFGPKGTSPEKISSASISNLARVRGEVFGIRHDVDDESSKYILVRLEPRGKAFDFREIAEVNDFPVEFVWDADRLIYAAPGIVSTLECNGTQTMITRLEPGDDFSSLVRRPNGEIWVGTSWSLLCLSPTKNGKYSAFWFVSGK